MFPQIGLVVNEGSSHYRQTAANEGVDILVFVELQPGLEKVACRLLAPCGGPVAGLWRVPPLGSEVLVVFPAGELEAGGVIVGSLSSGAVPDGITATNLVMAGAEILAVAGDAADAVPLATKADVEALKSTFNLHTHPVSAAPGTTGVTTQPASSPVGTQIFKAE
jgi:hypothetical protein